MRFRHKYILTHALVMLMSSLMIAGMTGCSMANEPDEDVVSIPIGSEDYIYLSFAITSTSDQSDAQHVTRSGDDDTDADQSQDGHPAEIATADENYIDLDDIKLMLFDEDDRLIKVIDSGDYEIIKDDNNYNKTYTLRPRIHSAYFDYASDETVKFSLLMVTNLGGYNFNPTYFATITEISQQYSNYGSYNFSDNDLCGAFMFSPTRNEGDKLVGWTPSESSNRGIPMSGYKTFSISRAQLAGSTEKEPYPIGTINVQRALSKFRFLMDVESLTDHKMSMISIEVPDICKYGTFIPDLGSNVSWLSDHCNLETPTYLSVWKDQTDTAIAYKYADNVTIDGKEYVKFEAYTVELIHDNLPTVEFTINDDDSEGNAIFTFFYDLKNFVGLTVVRNHIYEFTVTVEPKEPKKLYMDYVVCNWIEKSAVIEFN